jgi:hypothetical protein
MHVWRWSLSGIDKGVDTVNDCLSASEPQHSEALVSELAGFQVVTWFSLGQSLRKACEEKGRQKHDRSGLGCVWSRYEGSKCSKNKSG